VQKLKIQKTYERDIMGCFELCSAIDVTEDMRQSLVTGAVLSQLRVLQ